jgi:hypothetical protein
MPALDISRAARKAIEVIEKRLAAVGQVVNLRADC